MPTIKLGTFGIRQDIDLRAGDTLGPYTIREADGNNTPINLTGCTIAGAISRRGAADGNTPLTIVPIDLTQGQYSFALTATQSAALVASDFFIPEATYAYKLTIQYPNGSFYTKIFGVINLVQQNLS